ncbi:MAG TPA: ATP-binding protein [Steroidobacteraceae bacterium]|jgi:two-component system sensor histidine kinase UhpB|nr:ATP-binding protein [Steroidobacteraceae bacterium]
MANFDTHEAASAATHVSARRDIAIVAAITLICALLAGYFELNERLFAMTRRWEALQLDEWPVVLLVLAVCLGWLSWRRYRQTQIELRARQVVEARLERALAENRELAHQHLRIQEAERKHLARELHDELGQYLNAIKLDAVALGEPEASARIVRAVDHVHAVVNDMIRRLRPAGLDELGLLAALENCVDHWRQRLPDARFTLSATGSFDGLSELLNLTLYRLTQEGLTNVYKHAAATRIDVDLRREDGRITLTVQDDGRGVDLQTRPPGFGLNGMRERVTLLGGELELDSAPGRGFSFVARLPADAGAER